MTFTLQPSCKNLCITPWIMHLHTCTNVYYIRNNLANLCAPLTYMYYRATAPCGYLSIMCIIITASVAWKPNPDEASKLRVSVYGMRTQKRAKCPPPPISSKKIEDSPEDSHHAGRTRTLLSFQQIRGIP